MTRKQVTRQQFQQWLSSRADFPLPSGGRARKPRNEHERHQREMEKRLLLTRRMYAPPKGSKFRTARSNMQFIVDPVTGQWWHRLRYEARKARKEARAAERKARESKFEILKGQAGR